LPRAIAGDHAAGLERLAQLDVEDHQSAGDAELDGIGLAVDAATLDGGEDVEGLVDVGDAEGSLAAARCAGVTKYSSNCLPLTVNLPEPGRRKTRAIALLRRPVP
jgi:hypothetical protein